MRRKLGERPFSLALLAVLLWRSGAEPGLFVHHLRKKQGVNANAYP
ncbi:hypothetical protein [Paenibacillus tianmuensis]|nr:hypothetical protein [Paenibacillus tianmuensis]